jgi:RHS repeat-associated protein/prepilin-type processing-associated H-X9-DG protein
MHTDYSMTAFLVCASVYHFTGKERDAESGLDYFGARYYASSMGRFMSPDWSADTDPIPYADITNPQTLNLYSYAGNNPLSNTDADGHVYHVCDQNGQNCSDQSDAQFDQNRQNASANGERYSNGNITFADGSAAGSYKQTDVDLPGDAASNQAGANMIGNGGMGMIKEFVVQSTIGAVTEGIGQGIGLGVDALRAAQAAKAAEAAADASRAVKFGAGKSATKWANQLLKRGWTQSEIADAVANGESVPAVNNINPANGATRYISPSSGKSVVVDNVTGEVIHVGGAGFKY